jgi:Flp pilus assembly protein TadG
MVLPYGGRLAGRGIRKVPLLRRRSARGQSVTEFALVLPLMLLILMGVIDFGRLYTTVISVESAAREAADYGTTYGAARWSADNLVDTERRMEERACVAASTLADYVDADSLPGSGCQNPAFSYCVTPDVGEPCEALDPADVCEDPARLTPCAVTVTLRYDFHLLVPFRVEMFGAHWGLPSAISFDRDSTFAITDIEAPMPSVPPLPTPTPAPTPTPEPTEEPSAEPTVEPTP